MAIALTCVALPVSSVADGGAGRAPPRRAGATAVKFAWGAPCRVPITEIASKKASTVKMTYDVVVEPAGSELRVRLEHFDFLEVNGIDVTTPEMRRQTAAAVALTAVIPVMRIARTGGFLGAVDLEKAVSRLLEQPMFKQKLDDSKKLRAVMMSPQMLETLTGKMSELWGTWVGAWLTVNLAPGDTAQLEYGVQYGTRTAGAPARITHLGDAAGAPGAVRFRLESEVRGAAFARAARGFLASMLTEMGVKESPEMVVTDGDRSALIEVETDPATLRPRHARFEAKTHVVFKDGRDTRDEERRDDTFHWDRAEGACAVKH